MHGEITEQAFSDGHRDSVDARELPIGAVAPSMPWQWLRQGWGTLWRTPLVSAFYGGLCAAAGLGAVMMSQAMPGLTVKFVIGLLMLGPFLAAGLYVTARRSLEGDRTGIGRSLALDASRRSSLALFGLVLVMVVSFWLMATAVLFALKVTTVAPTAYTGFLGGGLQHPLMMLFTLGIGALLAAAVFASSIVAVPLIVARDAGPVAAVQASWRAVMANPKPMLLWAAIIVGLMLLGTATAFVGMLVIFPLLGYASWHAYRDLIPQG
jgi:uncharacterized membrane protein